MASGLVCRANRPYTWLHRPACKREEKPCQLGAVHTWHKADMPVVSLDVRFRGLTPANQRPVSTRRDEIVADHHAALHYELDPLHLGYVDGRVARNCDYI